MLPGETEIDESDLREENKRLREALVVIGKGYNLLLDRSGSDALRIADIIGPAMAKASLLAHDVRWLMGPPEGKTP